MRRGFLRHRFIKPVSHRHHTLITVPADLHHGFLRRDGGFPFIGYETTGLEHHEQKWDTPRKTNRAISYHLLNRGKNPIYAARIRLEAGPLYLLVGRGLPGGLHGGRSRKPTDREGEWYLDLLGKRGEQRMPVHSHVSTNYRTSSTEINRSF